MPTYEFRCPDGKIIEKMFRISEVPQSIPCPDGSGEAVRIISGGAALLFKGSGFYITDYGKDGKKDQRTAGSSESKSGEGSSAKSGESSGGTGGSSAKSDAPKPAPPSSPSTSSSSDSSSKP